MVIDHTGRCSRRLTAGAWQFPARISRTTCLVGLLGLCLGGASDSWGVDSPEDAPQWNAVRTVSAPEAVQAAAADDTDFFAISSTEIARYDRRTGLRTGVSRGAAQHLNSGVIWEGKLYCAHSNYPRTPELSELRVLDLKTLELTVHHDFGDFGGSLTWAVRHDGSWWCNFAHYGNRNAQTFLVRFDDAWKERGRWTYPASVIARLGTYSLSGGLWHNGELLVTGHDDPLVFRLKLPEQGTELIPLGLQHVPFTGQGIAIDPLTGGLVGIHRARQELVLARPAQPTQLRVLTYNIHHARGMDDRLDLDRLARVIRAAEPDIVALQEVDVQVPRSGSVDQPRELARRLACNSAFGVNLPLNGGSYGNALLSRFPITRHENQPLPNPQRGEPRGVLICDLAVPTAAAGKTQPVRVLVTHFDHRPDPGTRLASVNAIHELLGATPTAPTLLCGDLNDGFESEVLRTLQRDWTRAGTQERPTFPANAPRTQIDYVLYHPATGWKVNDVRVLDDGMTSDHRALLAVLELSPQVPARDTR